VVDGVVVMDTFETRLVDVLANDSGSNLSITSIISNGGTGTVNIVDNKIEYIGGAGDKDRTFDIKYNVSGDGGNDVGTLTIKGKAVRYDSTFTTENVGDIIELSCVGDFFVDYGDGVVVGPTTTINGPSKGTGVVKVVSNNGSSCSVVNDVFTDIHMEICDDFTSANDTYYNCTKLENFTVGNKAFRNVESFVNTWRNCSNMKSFPTINMGKAKGFYSTWKDCRSMTTFGTQNTPNAKILSHTWSGCRSLKAFPGIDTSNVTNMQSAWLDCQSMETFPMINTSKVTNMQLAWKDNVKLKSFPAIDTSNVTIMNDAWRGCRTLKTFPVIDVSKVVSLRYTWGQCAG